MMLVIILEKDKDFKKKKKLIIIGIHKYFQNYNIKAVKQQCKGKESGLLVSKNTFAIYRQFKCIRDALKKYSHDYNAWPFFLRWYRSSCFSHIPNVKTNIVTKLGFPWIVDNFWLGNERKYWNKEIKFLKMYGLH